MNEEMMERARRYEQLKDQKVYPPEYSCEQGQSITKACINPQCSSALSCKYSDCEHCGEKKHPTCPSIPLKGLALLLNNRIEKYEAFSEKASTIETEVFNTFEKSRIDIIFQYKLKELGQKNQDLVNKIFKGEEKSQISGADIQKLYEILMKEKINEDERANFLLSKYKDAVEKIISQLTQLKEEIFDQFSRGVSLDSHIVKRTDSDWLQRINFLTKELNKPIKINLLYRASQNKFSASEFHKKCDNIADTLTIVKTEFGKTIGGFTHYPWNSVHCDFVSDPNKKSFIFSLDLMEKFVPKDGNKQIGCFTNFGPVFGGDQNDIAITDNCHLNATSGAYFPSVYNREGADSIINNQESYKAFSGATQEFQFKVLEYEVFEVVYQ